MWLIALGVLGALAAGVVGFLDLFAIPPGTRAFRVGLVHMTLNLLVTVAYAANFLWRHAGHAPGAGVGGGMLTLNAVSFVVLGVSGYLGGKLAYRYGVRVADEATQAEGFVSTHRPLAPPTDHIQQRGRAQLWPRWYAFHFEEFSWTSPH